MAEPARGLSAEFACDLVAKPARDVMAEPACDLVAEPARAVCDFAELGTGALILGYELWQNFSSHRHSVHVTLTPSGRLF